MTNRPDRDSSHLMGWMCAGILLLAFSTYLLWSGPGKAWLCAPGEKGCAREWLAALSGWVAIIAAAPTIYFLNKQIRDANRHHTDTIMLQLQPTFALAQRIAEHAYHVQNLANHIILVAGPEPQTADLASQQMEQVLRQFERLELRMASVDYNEFESRVGSGQPGVLQSLREEIRSLREYVGKQGSVADRVQRFLDRRDRLAHCANRTMKYSAQCADHAGAFVDQWLRASGRSH